MDYTALPITCLSVDLEVRPGDGTLYALGGVRSDRGTAVTLPGTAKSLPDALAALDELATGVDALLGHNVISFDVPHLQAASPGLRLLRLPVVDTLRLSPLAHPANPYHHLVKHYQEGGLKRGRLNDPHLDALLALELFADQCEALGRAHPELLTAWHWLTTLEEGMAGFDLVFSHVRGSPRPGDEEGQEAVLGRLSGRACLPASRDASHGAATHAWPLAYALAWLSVAEGNSVMPPWVRHQFPEAGRLVERLRDRACTELACSWCRERQDARKELKRWFGFDDFRAEPADDQGRPVQKQVVEAAMAREDVLATLPTGAGKSLCYQVPALSRYAKTGALTVVISPLVALMADQVAGLERRGISAAVTINGMLSMPERADALDRVRLGDAGILLISPEQLRSVSVGRALQQREIGAWVVDEAHCLSQWGHDFRPDYRYIGRFIRERAGDNAPPPVWCLTATAKPDVTADIVDYFRDTLGVDLRVFDAGSQRTNLEFVVVETTDDQKFANVQQLLEAELAGDTGGGAIVFCATRARTEAMAGFLRDVGVAAAHFHAGLLPDTKRTVQEAFIGGELQVIAATSAFGMGIDKPDVRVVIHADIPGSLENYLQEAGRAGRDQEAARCILLYTDNDVERQFGLAARSRLQRHEIQAVLRALRSLDRRHRLEGEVVATPGEILLEDEEKEFERDSATDDTRVRTAVAWLEEAMLVSREANHVRVFPSSLRVNSIEEARARLARSQVTDGYQRRLLRIVEALFEAPPDQGLSTDELMSTVGFSPADLRAALHDLDNLGIASNDTTITVFVHAGVANSSRNRLQAATTLEEALIGLLRETAPDLAPGEASTLYLRHATQRLKDEGHAGALPELLWRLIRSIAADGRDEAGVGGSLSVRRRDAETVAVTLRRKWSDLERTAELRRVAAARLLDHLLGTLPSRSQGTDLLAETTLGKLVGALQEDLFIRSRARTPDKLMDRALLWLHEQQVIQLNRGLTVFRPAMTIRIDSDGRRSFNATDFTSLQIHYDEQVRQIHVMAEYAEQGLRSMTGALQMAVDYFRMPESEFLERWLPHRDAEMGRQTTAESWRAIVDELRNPEQRAIVADDREQTNALVLAGPGSGKTRVLVHRIAYLLRVRRENPRSIIALTYNRHAAVEIRQRLAELVGADARGVVVMTCHALAMRLVGASYAGRIRQPDTDDFDEVLHQAIALLRGDGLPPDEVDELRSRLLTGFRWVLIDEYQDLSPAQYDLISALAGRTLGDSDSKLTLLAVGDDDQNIYAFTGASVEFIRRFEADYDARSSYLTGNYRSTKHIIEAANAVITPARERMKVSHPLGVDRARRSAAAGGAWEHRDPVARGRVQVLPAGDTPLSQARAAVAELQRLASLDSEWDWSRCGVIARDWSFLDPVRTLCEHEGIPAQLAHEEISTIWRLRETQALVGWLREREAGVIASPEIRSWLSGQPQTPWNAFLREALDEYELETGSAETPREHAIEWFAEWSREARRQQQGLLLLTAHRAKGLEFDHVIVLDGNWERVSKGEDPDAPRRLYYVAMTRARHTLGLMRFAAGLPLQESLRGLPAVLHRDGAPDPSPPHPELMRRYLRLGLGDVFIGFAGYRAPSHQCHRALGALVPGGHLEVRPGDGRWTLLDERGIVVGQLAQGFRPPAGMRCIDATVLAIAKWERTLSAPEHQEGLRAESWEVVVPELVFEPASGTPVR